MWSSSICPFQLGFPSPYSAARNNGYTAGRAAPFVGKALAHAREAPQGLGLPTDPTERGGPPPLVGLSPGLCGSVWRVAYFTHRTIGGTGGAGGAGWRTG